MASSTTKQLQTAQLEALSDTGNQASIKVTLSGTPGTVTSVTLPDSAKGIKIHAVAQDIRFAVGQTLAPVTVIDTADQTVVAADFAVGGFAIADQTEVRSLHAAASRVLQISSLVASVVVHVEAF